MSPLGNFPNLVLLSDRSNINVSSETDDTPFGDFSFQTFVPVINRSRTLVRSFTTITPPDYTSISTTSCHTLKLYIKCQS